MFKVATLPFESVEKALAFASTLGVDRRTILDAAAVGDGCSRVAFASVAAIYEQAARLTGDPAFGLHVGERTSARMYGMLGYMALNSATFGEALSRLIEFQAMWSDAVGLALACSGRRVRLRYWHDGALPPHLRRQESEQMLAALITFACDVLGSAVRPVSVMFEHAAPDDRTEHARVFRCPLQFAAAVTEIVFTADLLDRPIAGVDAMLGALMREQAARALADRRETPALLIDAARQCVGEAVFAGRPVSLATVAAELAVGPRTLQRRLRDERLTLRELIEETRIAQARQLLADRGLPIGRIAHRLGYSQASAFHRAFVRAVGMTPLEWRRHNA